MVRYRVIALCAGLVLGSTAMMAAGKGDAAKGKVVFGYCTSCHNADSTEKKSGPGLKGLYKKDKLNNGKKPADASVKARIEEGGGGMPPYREMLSEAEKEDLLAYLRTL